MKILALMLLLVTLPAFAYAERVEYCDWIWSSDLATTVANAPASIYCDTNNDGSYKSETVASFIQNTRGADQVTIQYNTTWDNSALIHGVKPCENTASTGDLNYKGCIRGSCDTGTTTYNWYTISDIVDDYIKTTEITPIGDGFRLSVNGDAATCWTVRTMVYWK